MSISTPVLREFERRFAFDVDYLRGAGTTTLSAYARGLNDKEQAALVGGAGQDTLFFMCAVSVLEVAGLYPPQRFDRVRVDGQLYTMQTWRVARERGVKVFVKGYVKG